MHQEFVPLVNTNFEMREREKQKGLCLHTLEAAVCGCACGVLEWK